MSLATPDRFMRESDYPQVLKVWQTCFGDEEGYVRFFWENCFPLCRGLVYEEADKLVSMLFLLPGALAYKRSLLPAEYVYAVATLPEYRGKGYASNLVEFAAIAAKGEGKSALCLLPASSELYKYYAKLGFQTAFCRQDFQSVRIGPEGGPMPHVGRTNKLHRTYQFLMSCTCPEGGYLPHGIGLYIYYGLRRCVWGKQGYFDWPVHMLEYMHGEHIFNGGEVYADRNVTAFVTKEGKVKECSLNRPAKEPGGMLRPLDDRAKHWLKQTKGKAYLGLALD